MISKKCPICNKKLKKVEQFYKCPKVKVGFDKKVGCGYVWAPPGVMHI